MIASIRMAFALAVVAVVSAVLVPIQQVVVWTGIIRPGILPRLFHRIAVRMLGIRIKVNGQIASGRPLLIAANHVSWIDIVVLGSLAELSFVARADMARWPILGTFARLQRTVFVERERKRTSGAQVSQLGERLAAGDAMVLFAEGSTGDGNFLLPFKSTLFGAAQAALGESGAGHVVVQPVALAYTRLHGLPMGRQMRPVASWIGDEELGPHLKIVLRDGAIDVVVGFGEPIEFSPESNRKNVTRQAEEDVQRMVRVALRNP